MRDEANPEESAASIRAAQIVLPCGELQATLDFFVERLGFRLERISPADDPRQALISGHSMRILLERDSTPCSGRLQIVTDDPGALALAGRELQAPNGTRIELVPSNPPLVIPEGTQELVHGRAGAAGAAGAWGAGRAGMAYRDLIPGRLGGRFIASHIRIPNAGPVPDHVHYHAIRFQMIYCRSGWVRLVYEDQGPPFVLRKGDAVLQPARIRHRVLESSAGLEVVEIACPAEHDTFLDSALSLPTAELRVDRDFGGQRFVRHQLEQATWCAWGSGGLEFRDLGMAQATAGLASVRVVRRGTAPTAEGGAPSLQHAGELLFLFVIAGNLRLELPGKESLSLANADSLTIPARMEARILETSDDLELLVVQLPGLDPGARGPALG